MNISLLNVIQVYKNGKSYSYTKPTVFVNGKAYNSTKEHLNSTHLTSFPSPYGAIRGPLISIDGVVNAYIGRNIPGDSPPLYAVIKEFNIWFGELDESAILSNYLIGSQPDAISLIP